MVLQGWRWLRLAQELIHRHMLSVHWSRQLVLFWDTLDHLFGPAASLCDETSLRLSVSSGIYGVGSISFISHANSILSKTEGLSDFQKPSTTVFTSPSISLPSANPPIDCHDLFDSASRSSTSRPVFISLHSIQWSIVHGDCACIFFFHYPATSPVSATYAHSVHAR